ncbi:MAG: sterol desaturase family protein [Polyangiaceae bacterium]|nr:sterol desaturase family protein [Polyangiaceae bacterium]
MSLPESLESAGRLLLEPLASFLDPEDRVYWPFLAISGLMAAVVWARSRRKEGAALGTLLSFLLPRRIFLHPSSRLDVGIFVVNGVLRAGLPSVVMAQAGVAAVSSVGLQLVLGGSAGAAPGAWVPAAYTLCLFVADDFTRYLVHRVMHRVPVLWQIHKVHHSAEVLTPLTIYRVHPLESVLMTVRAALTAGLVTGAFFYLYRDALTGWAVVGVNVFSAAFTALGSNLRHSHVWISFGPYVERLFLSPAQHQVHHSSDPRHYDKNFGSFLALWDAIAGSLHRTGARERLRFGLHPEESNHGPTLVSALIDPLRAMLGRRGSPPLASLGDGPAAVDHERVPGDVG